MRERHIVRRRLTNRRETPSRRATNTTVLPSCEIVTAGRFTRASDSCQCGGAMLKRRRPTAPSPDVAAARPRGRPTNAPAARVRDERRLRHAPALRLRASAGSDCKRLGSGGVGQHDSRLADVAQPPGGIALEHRVSTRRRRRRCRRRQTRPVDLLGQHRRQRVAERLALEEPLRRSASRRRRRRTPRCPRACRPLVRAPAPAPCRPPCRG